MSTYFKYRSPPHQFDLFQLKEVVRTIESLYSEIEGTEPAE
jgi:hypothetical protein